MTDREEQIADEARDGRAKQIQRSRICEWEEDFRRAQKVRTVIISSREYF
jgi:hypothetical protein